MEKIANFDLPLDVETLRLQALPLSPQNLLQIQHNSTRRLIPACPTGHHYTSTRDTLRPGKHAPSIKPHHFSSLTPSYGRPPGPSSYSTDPSANKSSCTVGGNLVSIAGREHRTSYPSTYPLSPLNAAPAKSQNTKSPHL